MHSNVLKCILNCILKYYFSAGGNKMSTRLETKWANPWKTFNIC